jgi:acetate---CoA ligase (ADP-forming)
MRSDQRYSAAAIDRLLRPRSIAVVGASATPNALGASVLANLDRAKFHGAVHLVNPNRAEIGGRPCIPSVDQLPASVDCVVLAIPRAGVLDAVLGCAKQGVGGVIIFSAGFAEAGMEGRVEQERIRAISAEYGMIVEGPNCVGMVNYVDGVPLTFVTTELKPTFGAEGIAILSQSGAMAAVLGVSLTHRALEISFSISTGNEAASGVEDFLEYVIGDPHTKVVAMIVEQFRQPHRFLALVHMARAAGKTVVLLHPGSSSAARESATTHTGAMTGDYLVMKTKVEHAGVVMVETIEELVDVLDILIRCHSLPQAGAAVFTESGAFKALTLDLCETLGLQLPALSDGTAAGLRAVLPDFIPPTNPLDLTAQGLIDPGLYRRTLPIVLADERFGSVVLAIILTDEATSGLKLPPILQAIRETKPNKPLVFCALDEGAAIDPAYVGQLRNLGVPFFPAPSRAFRALARLTAHASAMKRTCSAPVEIGVVAALEPGVITEYRSKRILGSLGIPVPSGALATTTSQARATAERIGYPVVLKAQASALYHKSDAGGVALNISDAAALDAAWARMHADISALLPELALDGILVEKMAPPGIEMIVGARNDSEWGVVLLVGFGGVVAEALRDVRLLAPELPVDAIVKELFRLRSAPLLQGFRGAPALDAMALARIVARLGRFMLSCPWVQEVDINPVAVYPEGAVALDALILAGRNQAGS